MTGHLAWRGLGTVESSDFAPGRLNIRILSPEPKRAVSAVRPACGRRSSTSRSSRSPSAPFGGLDKLKQAHPLPAKGTFSLS